MTQRGASIRRPPMLPWDRRPHARECRTPAELDAIEAPADADQFGEWMRDGDSASQFRRFTINTATVRTLSARKLEVRAEGEQFADGAELRVIALDADSRMRSG